MLDRSTPPIESLFMLSITCNGPQYKFEILYVSMSFGNNLEWKVDWDLMTQVEPFKEHLARIWAPKAWQMSTVLNIVLPSSNRLSLDFCEVLGPIGKNPCHGNRIPFSERSVKKALLIWLRKNSLNSRFYIWMSRSFRKSKIFPQNHCQYSIPLACNEI